MFKTRDTSVPCYKCEDRVLYCQCTCPRYAAFVKARKDDLARRQKDNHKHYDFAAYREESICRTAGKPRRQR